MLVATRFPLYCAPFSSFFVVRFIFPFAFYLVLLGGVLVYALTSLLFVALQTYHMAYGLYFILCHRFGFVGNVDGKCVRQWKKIKWTHYGNCNNNNWGNGNDNGNGGSDGSSSNQRRNKNTSALVFCKA